MQEVTALFLSEFPIIGMVHLGPLPGSVRSQPGHAAFEAVLERAAQDARNLQAGGVNGIMVENYFDAPFVKDSLPPHTIASMTRAVLIVRQTVGPDMPVGVNCLRNDARSAIAIAHATQAQFVRINVFVGAAVTDQGIIEGAARTALLYRRELGSDVAIFADVYVKHAAQLGSETYSLEDAARDAAYRGLADALIVSGASTGTVTDPATVQKVARAVPETPVFIGSGFTVETAPPLKAAGAAGAIVGTSLKKDGRVENPVDSERVRFLMAATGYRNPAL